MRQHPISFQQASLPAASCERHYLFGWRRPPRRRLNLPGSAAILIFDDRMDPMPIKPSDQFRGIISVVCCPILRSSSDRIVTPRLQIKPGVLHGFQGAVSEVHSSQSILASFTVQIKIVSLSCHDNQIMRISNYGRVNIYREKVQNSASRRF